MKKFKRKKYQKVITAYVAEKCVKRQISITAAAIKSELFHLQTSIDCLNRILNDQRSIPREEVREVFRKNNPICFSLPLEELFLF